MSKIAKLIDWGHLSQASAVLLDDTKIADMQEFNCSKPQPSITALSDVQVSNEAWEKWCTVDDVSIVLRRKQRISSGGLSGFRINHLASLLPYNIGTAVWSIMGLTLMLSPQSVAWDYISAAALTPLDKDKTGVAPHKDVRPIAVQDIWARLLSAIIWEKEGKSLQPKHWCCNSGREQRTDVDKSRF